MTRHLLDANVLIALGVPNHQHEPAAQRWLASNERIATCSITQMSLIRMLVRAGASGPAAVRLTEAVVAYRNHQFWDDPIRPDRENMRAVIGHRQVSDFYLAALARHHGGRLATFDHGLAAAHPDVVDLVSTS